ncbi:uncharacterized protein PV06_06134 [Exophiala oligosperma]|uniref:Major facilitator superfamily (MFS) profile domain-containing protein n=1 Tax=Exophiala oligosperma TaxID=215243 RepID=A0A0D2BYR4_9EURO|nr:uncharacterized protein PV06_06134 [Exophiala oligosperma]KIW42602.1 hypothetical protein PV06_06134 [Exophiala oligosperma]
MEISTIQRASSSRVLEDPQTEASTAQESTHARELFEVEEVGNNGDDDDIEYPTGTKLWLAVSSFCLASFLHGLDLTIVAVAVPSLTDQFKTVNDIGWYSASYMMTSSALIFFFGKMYTLYSIKPLFVFGIAVFELGSLLCTFSQSSHMFILGRSIAGVGTSAIQGGGLKLMRHCFPVSKLPMAMSLVSACSSSACWRACFAINIPLGVLCIVFILYGFHDFILNPDESMPWRAKIRCLDPVGTLLVIPSVTCLLMGLQWGGIKYGWKDWRIILVFVLFGVLSSGFAYLQYRQGDVAILPPRIVKKRSILAAMWFSSCCNGVLAVTEYYIAIYFQGVQGLSATTSGLLGLPMIVGLGVATVMSGLGTSAIGYYYPFMFATSIFAPVASGLLTTLDPDESHVKVAALLAFLGIAIGLSLSTPSLIVQATLSPKDISIGAAIVGFGGGMGSALWTCASAALFQNRLVREIQQHEPGANVTAIADAGLSDLRRYIGSEKLRVVLAGYNEAVSQTLYIPLALGILTVAGSIAAERKSVKSKQT